MRYQPPSGLEAGLFHGKQSVEVYVRHTKDCPHHLAGRDFRKCSCPKYLYVYKDGHAKRVSAKTGSWAQAEKKSAGGTRLVGSGIG